VNASSTFAHRTSSLLLAMRTTIPILATAALISVQAYAQGTFYFSNFRAPTRLWTIDGPPAGRGIWAQMLAGTTVEDLVSIGVPREHLADGVVYGGVVTVPGIPEFETAYLQMVAWDGQLWGTNLAGVPTDQLGRTDTVPHDLGGSIMPALSPLFTQPAIVPIPEPSVLALTVLAGAALFIRRRLRHRTRHPR